MGFLSRYAPVRTHLFGLLRCNTQNWAPIAENTYYARVQDRNCAPNDVIVGKNEKYVLSGRDSNLDRPLRRRMFLHKVIEVGY
jgi:hypothetical protein